uniref:Retrotransposon gag protein n=1 Tax=Solanum tuberosum TaxID=4113 RepID=M1D8V3_SOLTU
MLSQAVTNQVGQQRGARQEEADTSRIREFLRMNPPSFTDSSTTEDPENFIEELKKWKKGRAEDAPPASWACFEEAFFGHFFPRELKETKVEEEKLSDREEFRNKKAKIGNESGQQKGNVNRSSFQQKQKGPVPSSASAPAPRNKGEYNGQNSQNFKARLAQSQGSVAQGGNWAPTCVKCGRIHPGSGHQGNRAQSSSVGPPDRAAPRGATSSNGGKANCLYAITSRQEQENSPDVVTSMIKAFTFDVYALLDPGASLYFVTPYVANKFDVLPEKLREPFCVSTPVGESILA